MSLPPVAVCVRCGDYCYNAEAINQRCSKQHRNGNKIKRCDGCYRSTLRSDDWEKCRECGGTGISEHKGPSDIRPEGQTRCYSCQGSGWVLVRQGFRV